MKLLCLTPFRNSESDLPGFFRSVTAFCDGVVALDDGSTDETARLLAANRNVFMLLKNRVRRTYAGWNDADNRQRLLEAAGQFYPDWIIQLDADERIDRNSGQALRKFLDTEACKEFAYGFDRCRMINDARHYDKSMVVYRLFAYRPGLRLPGQKLHLIPVPTAVPQDRWFRLTIRIKHLAGLTTALRRRRFEKFKEADPTNIWQASYRNLLDKPEAIKRWKNQAGTSVLFCPERHRKLQRLLHGAGKAA